MNYVEWKTSKGLKHINYNFIDGAYIHIVGEDDFTEYDVEYYDNKTNQLIYKSKLKSNWWAKTSKNILLIGRW
jgi:hypothetical protein